MNSKFSHTVFLKNFLPVLAGMFFLSAIPVRQAGSEKNNRYMDAGVFVGGHDQGPINLLSVRHNIQNRQGGDKIERIVFDVGGDKIETSTGRPGFFHITIQKSPRRVVIDLEDISQSKVTAEQFSRLVEKSPHFSKVRFFYDNKFKNLTIEMPLKDQAKIEVFELVALGKPGRIVLDAKGAP